MLNVNKNKSYYLFNFINIFIKNKYLFFIKDEKIKILISEYKVKNFLRIKSGLIKKLFIKNNFFNIFKNNMLLIYSNELDSFEKLIKYNNVLAISSSMYLINNKYNKNIYDYYLYYKDNYLLYKKIIFLFFEKYYFFIFFILRNLIILLNMKKKYMK